MSFHPWGVGLEPSFHRDRQSLIPSPVDEAMAILQNIVKSSRFTASVFHPVAPIVGENVTKLGLIEGSIADLEILHFLRHFGLRQSSGVAIGKFSFRRLLINTFSYQLGCDILDKN